MPPRQIVILRHAEKPDDIGDPHLSPAGTQRATMLATLIPQRFPNPDFLFATAPSKESNRPVETLTPLEIKCGPALNKDIADKDYKILASEMLGKPEYSGKLAIICWHHGKIPDLAMALGVPRSEVEAAPEMTGKDWNPGIFDSFWSIKFADGGISFTTSKQVP
jgi:hypothetical protein